MQIQREGELDCKLQCDAELRRCEEGRIYTEECDQQWDDCMNACLSACEAS